MGNNMPEDDLFLVTQGLEYECEEAFDEHLDRLWWIYNDLVTNGAHKTIRHEIRAQIEYLIRQRERV